MGTEVGLALSEVSSGAVALALAKGPVKQEGTREFSHVPPPPEAAGPAELQGALAGNRAGVQVWPDACSQRWLKCSEEAHFCCFVTPAVLGGAAASSWVRWVSRLRQHSGNDWCVSRTRADQ